MTQIKQKLIAKLDKLERNSSKSRANSQKNKILYKASKSKYNIVNKSQRRKYTLNGVISRTQKGATLVGFEASPLRILWVVPFYIKERRLPIKKGGEAFMNDKPLFECWCVLASKIVIFENRVEIKKAFGLSTQTIPVSKIASVNNTLMGIVFETTGGAKPDKLQPWDANKKKEIVDLVFKLINKK